MAETRVTPSGGVHGLGGSRDTELHVPAGHSVYTTDKNLAAARQNHPEIDWFACFVVRDQDGNYATSEYTVVLNRPTNAASKFYYFDGQNAQQVDYSDAPNKGNRRRIQVKLKVGDPPVGMT